MRPNCNDTAIVLKAVAPVFVIWVIPTSKLTIIAPIKLPKPSSNNLKMIPLLSNSYKKPVITEIKRILTTPVVNEI